MWDKPIRAIFKWFSIRDTWSKNRLMKWGVYYFPNQKEPHNQFQLRDRIPEFGFNVQDLESRRQWRCNDVLYTNNLENGTELDINFGNDINDW